MKRIILLGTTLCLASGVYACDAADQPTAVQTDSWAASRESAGPDAIGQRPFVGQIVGSDEYGAPCAGGAGISLISTGYGTLTHFGRTVMVSPSCLDPDTYEVLEPMTFTFTAANGDVAGGMVTDYAFTSYGFDLYAEFTWGTGRFEGVSGEAVFPTSSTGSGSWTSTVRGWISY